MTKSLTWTSPDVKLRKIELIWRSLVSITNIIWIEQFSDNRSIIGQCYLLKLHVNVTDVYKELFELQRSWKFLIMLSCISKVVMSLLVLIPFFNVEKIFFSILWRFYFGYEHLGNNFLLFDIQVPFQRRHIFPGYIRVRVNTHIYNVSLPSVFLTFLFFFLLPFKTIRNKSQSYFHFSHFQIYFPHL